MRKVGAVGVLTLRKHSGDEMDVSAKFKQLYL